MPISLPLEYDDMQVRLVPTSEGRHMVIAETPDGRGATTQVRVPDVVAPMIDEGWLSAAEAVGRRLFDAVVAGGVKQIYDRSRATAERDERGLRLRLNLTAAPELVSCPWELLFEDEVGFLAAAGTTSLVRSLDVSSAARPTDAEPPLRILGIAAAPHGEKPISAAAERKALETALAANPEIVLEWVEPPTLAALTKRLSQPDGPEVHVLHFVGHGRHDADHPDGALGFEDAHGRVKWVEAVRLAQLVPNGIRLIVLNACQGAVSSSADAFTGVAARLVRRGIPAVIGMRDEILDSAAVRLSEQFYVAVAGGASMEAALIAGRHALAAEHLDVDVGLPVLFLRGKHSRLRSTELPRRPAAVRRAVAANNVGVALMRRGKVTAATEAYRLGAELGSGTAANNLGNALRRGGNREGAIEAFERAAALGHAAGANNLGSLLEGDARISAFRRAAELGNPKGANNLAYRLWERGDHDEAIAFYEQAIELGNGYAANSLARRYRDRGDTERAVETFRSGMELGYAPAANNLGRLLRREGDLDGAIVAFERAVKLGHAKAAANLEAARAKRDVGPR